MFVTNSALTKMYINSLLLFYYDNFSLLRLAYLLNQSLKVPIEGCSNLS